MEKKRLTELETKVSYQDQTIEELNQVVIELRKEIETMEKKVQHLMNIVENDGLKDQSQEEPPPHY